ncbi:UDP-glucose 4-epimerase family protein [Pseudidiomarina terrestris]|uniref:UDP-glucose 4-epimerase family protein n=1 Tax=Pseudidiomarina terrestris TaxID=2820060 RepID=UPI002654D1A6|nr:SDR family oxidoreductase [Pseudidiomarina sp. 1ASP75-5]MDN7134548.1 SDR family oxidoreductase [Pseudidiomarina sp. 1ASP75-5]
MSTVSGKTVGITGASGFVGASLAHELSSQGFPLVCLGRSQCPVDSSFVSLDLGADFDVTEDLSSVDVFVHCAARAHVMDETLASPLDAYLKANTSATLRLAEQAAAAGVSRFIYLSSVKALGESTAPGEPFRYDSPLAPLDDYGVSKARAEKGLQAIAARTGMEVTIIRPPLVYGPGVKANFASMLGLANRNLPLPLASLSNKRSLVALDNLVDLIITCISHPDAGNQTFMVSDDHDVSTPELLAAMTRAHGKSPRLAPCPPGLLSFGASLVGKRAVADRLLGSLQVDITHTKEVLGWAPKARMEDVLKQCIKGVSE